MKIIYLTIIALFFTSSLMSYPQMQLGIFSQGNDLVFKVKSTENCSTVITNMQFTFKYSSTYIITVSNPVTSFGLALYGNNTAEPFKYLSYAAAANTSINWIANTEYEIMRVTISGGSGSGIFFLTNEYNSWYFECNNPLWNGSDITHPTIPFYVESTESPLPIQLSSFSHSNVKNNIKLNWKTSKEINNKEFIVERKIVNSENWNIAGTVEGKGNTNTITEYSFSDNNLQTGKYNYRLKQVDYNGNFEYHNLNGVVEVGVPDKFELSQNYPNPFNPTTKIDYDLPFDSKVHIVLFDMTGREVKTLVNETRTAGYYTVNFNASDLSSGIYFYRIISKSANKDFVSTKKMMLIK